MICTSCGGLGNTSETRYSTCPGCGGFGTHYDGDTCHTCHGTRTSFVGTQQRCGRCGGTGSIISGNDSLSNSGYHYSDYSYAGGGSSDTERVLVVIWLLASLGLTIHLGYSKFADQIPLQWDFQSVFATIVVGGIGFSLIALLLSIPMMIIKWVLSLFD